MTPEQLGEQKRQEQYLTAVLDCQNDFQAQTGFTRRYWIHTYGCQLNENDGEKIAGQLHEMGYIPAYSINEADLIILNTCSIRENAVDRLFGNLGQIKNMRRDRPDLMVALCGCMMKQEENLERIEKSFSFVDIIFGPQDIHRLPELLYNRLTQEKRQYYIGDQDTVVEGLPVHHTRRFRALASIMFGCNNFCTYCIVPFTRGRERSRKASDILNELNQLADAGFREVMLLGQNVNSYGNDLEPDEQRTISDFADLLKAGAQIEGLYRIRYMTSHPKDLSVKMLETIAAHQNIERHLHLPVQSGSNRILKLMNRGYTREKYLKQVELARQLIPDITFSTDIIVGFPGETEADFAQTLDLMRQVKFDSAFTFIYSERPGTPATRLTGAVEESVIKERFARLIDLQNEHSLAANQKWIGREVEVLVEGPSSRNQDVFSGRNSHNHLINFTIDDLSLLPAKLIKSDGTVDADSLEGGLARIKITAAQTFLLKGVLEEWKKSLHE